MSAIVPYDCGTEPGAAFLKSPLVKQNNNNNNNMICRARAMRHALPCLLAYHSLTVQQLKNGALRDYSRLLYSTK